MANIQLIIDNQVADVYSEADVIMAISYSIADVSAIDTRCNATSKTIRVPATSRNRRIFGYADDLTVSSFKGQKVSMPGVIRDSGVDVLVGMVNLKTYQQTPGDSYFEITIVGNCSEWVEFMSNTKLRDMGSDGAHYKTEAVVNASLSGALTYIYGLVNNGFPGGQVKIKSVEDDGNGKAMLIIDGDNEIENLRTNITSGWNIGYAFDNDYYNKRHLVGNIGGNMDGEVILYTSTPFMGTATGIIRAVTAKLVVEDRPLMVSVAKVMEKMFTLAGYRITSDFLSSNFFKGLFVLPGAEKMPEAFATSNTCKYGKAGDQDYTGVGTVVVFDKYISGAQGIYTPSGAYYTAYGAQMVKFKASVNVKGTEGYVCYLRYTITPSGGSSRVARANSQQNNLTLSASTYGAVTREAELRLQNMDRVQVELVINPMGGVNGSVRISKDDTTLETTGTTKVVIGSYIKPYSFLPDVKMIDFVKGVMHLFNLYFMADVHNKVVYIEPRDTFYRRDKSVDLTGKLDASQAVMLEELGADMNKTVRFKYKEDTNDKGVEKYNAQNTTPFSDYSVDLDNKFATIGETALENPLFAPTLMDTFAAAGFSASLLPKIWGEPKDGDTYPETLTEYVPRILYFAGMRDCKTAEAWTFQGTTYNEYPLFCSHDVDSVNDTSLLFNPQATEPDLYFKHYSNQVRTINSGRRITAYFNLTPNDIQFLTTPDPYNNVIRDFRALFYMKYRNEVVHCRLEKITDYNAGSPKSTKVVLVTDVDNISQQVTPFISSMEFTNDALALGTAYANVCVFRYGTLWSDARGGSMGSVATQSNNYGVGSSGGSQYRVERAFLFYDTSNLPDACTIVEAYIDLYKVSGDYSQEVAVFAGGQANIVTTADFQKFGGVNFGESAPAAPGLHRIYLNASGIAAISKTGWTKFCLRERNYDVLNTPPPSAFSTFKTYLVSSPATYLNKLVIKYME